jgi:hypothetical protein
MQLTEICHNSRLAARIAKGGGDAYLPTYYVTMRKLCPAYPALVDYEAVNANGANTPVPRTVENQSGDYGTYRVEEAAKRKKAAYFRSRKSKRMRNSLRLLWNFTERRFSAVTIDSFFCVRLGPGNFIVRCSIIFYVMDDWKSHHERSRKTSRTEHHSLGRREHRGSSGATRV